MNAVSLNQPFFFPTEALNGLDKAHPTLGRATCFSQSTDDSNVHLTQENRIAGLPVAQAS